MLSRASRKTVTSLATRTSQRALSFPSVLTDISAHLWEDSKMKASLDAGVYDRLKAASNSGEETSKEDKDAIAKALFEFATERGASKFCHQFSPVRFQGLGLGGAYAGKNDLFIGYDFGSPLENKPIITGFKGSQLFSGETDGSSFPNGGLRATHTAAAFVSWDRLSPPYVRGDTLFIPSCFVTHYGGALDDKTPLLRSMDAVNRQSVRLLRAMGDTETQRAYPVVGVEQEFFVVDKEMFLKRPDLRECGRTLLGTLPSRGQNTDLNYFGAIPPRVKAYLAEVQSECLKMGISLLVEHNEVAPGQHEVSPIFTTHNVAADQNNLLMDVMNTVAFDHNLVCLNHEKPFANLNGSGKHANWSLQTDTKKNLCDSDASSEAELMATMACLAQVQNKHGDMMRNGVASAANDHRLGAQEAPPAIMSLYTGVAMEGHIDKIIGGGALEGIPSGGQTLTPATAISPFRSGLEDRNRTAPFPFCGNRFEFRAVGSSQNVAWPMTILNTAFAEAAGDLAAAIEGGKSPRDAIADMFKANRSAIFNGNGYGAEWNGPGGEAEKRGLLNIPTTTDALKLMVSDKNVKLFDSQGVFSKDELEARAETYYEHYINHLAIEAGSMIEMLRTGVIPACAKDMQSYSGDASALAGDRPAVYKRVATTTDALDKALASAPEDSLASHAQYMTDVLKPAMQAARDAADAAEGLIDAELYPYPSYRDIMLGHHADAPEHYTGY